MPAPRRPVAYIRVSTEERDQLSSLERQKAAALRCGIAEADVLVEQESGRNAERPQWLALQDRIRAGEVETVWADRNDRLARDLMEARLFFALCARHGTAWRFWSEPWLDSDSPGAEEIRDRAAYDAEAESRRISSRLRRSYAHRAAHGLPHSAKAPFGLRLEGHGDQRRYVLDDRPLAGDLSVADAARLLVDLYLQAGTIWTATRLWRERLAMLRPVHRPELIEQVERWTQPGLRSWLALCGAELAGHTVRCRNRRIESADGRGKAQYKRLHPSEWELNRDTHPALIEPAKARKVVLQLEENRNRGLATARGKEKKAEAERLPSFSALTYCSGCGRRVVLESVRKPTAAGRPAYRHLRCSGARGGLRLCDQPGINERTLVYGLMPHLVNEAERVASLMIPAGNGGTADGDTDAEGALEQQLERTRVLARETGLPEMRQAVLRLESQLAAAQAARQQESAEQEGRRQAARQLAQLLPSIGADLYTHAAVRRQVLAAIERIEIGGGQVVSVTLAAGRWRKSCCREGDLSGGGLARYPARRPLVMG
jgi:DNA invertase Pin-like site-specific DNA recombinase